MARKSTRDGQSKAGYFTAIFTEKPEWLETRSNDEVIKRYLADHPEETEASDRVKSALANTKSNMRKGNRKGKRKKKAMAAAVAAGGAAPVKVARPRNLETLEIQIDDCLTVAKNLDREGLADIISLLRRARNEVVWKSGQ